MKIHNYKIVNILKKDTNFFLFMSLFFLFLHKSVEYFPKNKLKTPRTMTKITQYDIPIKLKNIQSGVPNLWILVISDLDEKYSFINNFVKGVLEAIAFNVCLQPNWRNLYLTGKILLIGKSRSDGLSQGNL